MPQLLDYAPRVKWHRRRWRAIVLLVLIGGLLADGYFQRPWLARHWRLTMLSYRQWRCLHHTDPPETVVYEEDPTASANFLKRSGYVSLPTGQAIKQAADWALFRNEVMRDYPRRGGYLWDTPQDALVFLHERKTAGGEKLLVWVNFAIIPRDGHGYFRITLMHPGTGSHPPSFAGSGGGDEMFWLLSPPKVLKELEPHPSKHHLRVFAGQPDPRDSSRFWFDYTIDGKLGRTFIRIRDPDPTSSNPTQARVERESSRSFTGG